MHRRSGYDCSQYKCAFYPSQHKYKFVTASNNKYKYLLLILLGRYILLYIARVGFVISIKKRTLFCSTNSEQIQIKRKIHKYLENCPFRA